MFTRVSSRRLVRELAPDEQPTSRLNAYGADALQSRELIALILGTPDALDVADTLLATFDASYLPHALPAELEQVAGIGPALARRLVAALTLGRRLAGHRTTDLPQIYSPSDAAKLFVKDMPYFQQEHFRVVILSVKNHILNDWHRPLYKGSLNSSVVRVAEVFRDAIRLQGASILVAHNHPSGDPTPSPEDIRITRDLRQAGELLGIPLLDHVVVGRGRFVSMKERGLGF